RRADSLLADAKGAGINGPRALPEDRLRAAPVIRDVVQALSAQTEHLDGGGMRPLDRPVIATISADPGQGYFARYDASAVIVRSDKPDLQLAALNAGAGCLIVTGGLPILSYVLERAEEDQLPLCGAVRTDHPVKAEQVLAFAADVFQLCLAEWTYAPSPLDEAPAGGA